jgi:hypothetical protein
MATLPEAPSRADFPDQESFEEALGFWQSRVGRIKGLAARQAESARASDSSDRTSDEPADEGAPRA